MKFIVEERVVYEESLKYYWDIKNVVDILWEEGKEERILEIVRELKKNGIFIDMIVKLIGLSKKEIEEF